MSEALKAAALAQLLNREEVLSRVMERLREAGSARERSEWVERGEELSRLTERLAQLSEGCSPSQREEVEQIRARAESILSQSDLSLRALEKSASLSGDKA